MSSLDPLPPLVFLSQPTLDRPSIPTPLHSPMTTVRSVAHTRRLPDNKQIDEALSYAEEHSFVDLKKLSPEGRVLIDDTRDIIETLRMMVREKNADELFQNAVWASYAGDPSRAKQDGVVPVSKDDVKKDADQGGFSCVPAPCYRMLTAAAAHLRVLLTLFVTNSEFRKIFKDLGFVGRDIFATTASKAADKARPSQHQLDQVDQEAPSKQWIGADGQRLGTQDTPDVALKGPSGSEVRYHPKDAPSDAQYVCALASLPRSHFNQTALCRR